MRFHTTPKLRRVIRSGLQKPEALPPCTRRRRTTPASCKRFYPVLVSNPTLRSNGSNRKSGFDSVAFNVLQPMQWTADQHIAWGLGWGLEPDAGSFFHWGDNGQFKAFVIGSLKDRSALVVFTNGSNGMAIMPDVIDRLMPGDHPAFLWLNYSRNVSGGGLLDWFRMRRDR